MTVVPLLDLAARPRGSSASSQAKIAKAIATMTMRVTPVAPNMKSLRPTSSAWRRFSSRRGVSGPVSLAPYHSLLPSGCYDG
jgi:hypothetical protein